MTANGDIPFQNYVVAVLDILGQGQTLTKMQLIEEGIDDKPGFASILDRTYRRVDKLRCLIADLDTGLRSMQAGLGEIASCSGRKAEFEEITGESLRFTSFSDLVMVYSPLYGNRAGSSLEVIKRLVSVLAAVQLTILAQGVPVRGGIEVGWAGPLASGEIYGAATASAYRLESACAKFPRIVVGRHLISFVDHLREQLQHVGRYQTCASFYKIVKGLIGVDDSGVHFVDFLGDEAFRQFGPDDLGNVARGQKFVETEHAKFLKAGNDKLASRYAVLRNYYKSRLHIWQ